MGKWTRRALLGGAAATVAVGAYGRHRLRRRPDTAPLGFSLSEEERARGVALLKAYPAIDAHAHPGQTFVRGAKGLPPLLQAYSAKGTFEKRTVGDMIEGGLTASSFAAVSDFNVLNLSKERGLIERRAFKEGEAWASYQTQIKNLKALADKGLVTPFLSPNDIDTVRQSGRPGAIWAVEGGGFLEGSIERLHEAYQDGIRSITLMHYRANEISNPMTASEDNSQLSATGDEMVREMNQLGMIVDLAHMPEKAAARALAVSDRPVMMSHTHIKTAALNHPRFVSQELARDVAASGGVIGAWPTGIGIHDLAGYGDRIFELIEHVGIDHVCMGTDMDANYKPVFSDYRLLPDLAGLLLKRGLSEQDAAKFFGGNLLRVWRDCMTVAS